MMFRFISTSPEWYLCLLIYNFCAFAMQMPIGILADKLSRNHLFAGIGCVLVGAAYGLTGIPMAATIVVGLGNGMFHIGGGLDVLNISEEKSSALGVFVSPGAFGIYFGTMLGRGSGLTALPVLLALLAAAALILLMRRVRPGAYVGNAPFSPEVSPRLMATVVCLFLVVCVRSYAGLAVSFPWKSAGLWGLALVCASAFGKTAGGFLSDRFGPLETAIFSLAVSALLFLFPQLPGAGVPAVFLFNMTMPITLWVVARIFPGAKGFSFGLLTFALFLGFVPVHLGVVAPLWLFAPAAVVSLVLMLVGLHRLKDKSRTRKEDW